MKLNISNGTKNLLYCLIGVVLVITAFVFGFKNFNDKNKALKQERTALKEEISKLDEIQLNREDYEDKIAENKAQIKKYYKEFPVLVQARDQILYAADLETKYNTMNIFKMSMGESEYLTGTEQDAMALYRVPTEMECRVGYEQLKDYLVKAPEDGTRKSVDEIVLTVDQETGLLVGKINMSMYYMTGIDQEYKPAEIKDVNIGTENIFQMNPSGQGTAPQETPEPQNQGAEKQTQTGQQEEAAQPSQEGQQAQQ